MYTVARARGGVGPRWGITVMPEVGRPRPAVMPEVGAGSSSKKRIMMIAVPV